MWGFSIMLDSYKLLAFVCAYKARFRSSVAKQGIKAYVLAGKLGMSTVTYKKYLGLLKERGYINQYGAIIKLSKIVDDLFPSKANKHLHFFKGKERKPDFKYYYELIKYAFAERNFNQQEYFIEKNYKLRKALDRFIGKQQYKHALKRFGVDCLEKLVQCLNAQEENVRTGKYHLSKLLGCSSATASLLLRKWHDQEKYERVVNTQFIPMFVCHESFDLLKSMGFKFILPSKGGFLVSLGSYILRKFTL